MLEFVNVSKSFWTGKTRKVILDRASFRVDLGHSMGILAPNGTGKTTLINLMAGLEKPDEGRIILKARISFPLGFMGGVINKHTGTENARYIARLYGLDPDYVEAFCRYLTGIEKYCRSAAVLRDGRLYMFDTLEEAKQLYNYEHQS
jgi:capsular polysaccharide transport system ATP-binding protein